VKRSGVADPGRHAAGAQDAGVDRPLRTTPAPRPDAQHRPEPQDRRMKLWNVLDEVLRATELVRRRGEQVDRVRVERLVVDGESDNVAVRQALVHRVERACALSELARCHASSASSRRTPQGTAYSWFRSCGSASAALWHGHQRGWPPRPAAHVRCFSWWSWCVWCGGQAGRLGDQPEQRSIDRRADNSEPRQQSRRIVARSASR
jgi:predicted secreted protein